MQIVLALAAGVIFVAVMSAARSALRDRRADARFRHAVEEVRKRGIPTTVAELTAYAQIPDSVNGAKAYEKAIDLLDGIDSEAFTGLIVISRAETPDDPAAPLSAENLAAARRFIDAHGDILELLHEAAGYEKAAFGIRWNAFMTNLPHCARLRRCARLLKLAAWIDAEDGKGDDALGRVEDCLAVGRSLRQEPTTTSYLVSLGISSIGVSAVERVLARSCPSDEALASLQSRLEKDAGRLSDTIALNADVMSWIYVHDRGLQGDYTPLDEDSNSLDEEGRAADRYLARIEAPIVLEAMIWAYDESAKLRAGYFAAPEVDWEKFAKEYSPLAAMTASSVYPGLTTVTEKVRARLRAASAAIAAVRFRKHTGSWPDSLEAIVPAWLNAVPVDPFSGRQMIYRIVGGGIMVYSVGEDRLDDVGSSLLENEPETPLTDGTDPLANDPGLWLRYDADPSQASPAASP